MSRIGSAYAQGLYTLAAEEALTGQILQQLQVLDESFSENPDFIRLLSAPNLSKQERCQILDDSFRGKIHGYVLNYLKLLTEKGYIRHFSDSVRAYTDQYNADNGVLVVEAVSAVALSQQQKTRLIQKLEAMTGKIVQLRQRIDPQVLGGLRLDYDGKRIDGTVKNRLEAVGKLLQNTVI